jgi:hypothetical protein
MLDRSSAGLASSDSDVRPQRAASHLDLSSGEKLELSLDRRPRRGVRDAERSRRQASRRRPPTLASRSGARSAGRRQAGGQVFGG